MAVFIVKRVLLMIPILFGVTFLTFVIVNASGSPVSKALLLNPRVKPEDIKNIEHNLGLDRPVSERYFIWVGNLLRGDLSNSLINNVPVRDRILNVMPNTLLLASLSVVVSLSIAVPVGIYSAVKRNSLFDRFFTTAGVAGFAVPGVWLGLMLIILFSVKFQEWGLPSLPVGGVRNQREDGGLSDRIAHLILPVVALTIPQLAGWIVYIRSQMLEVIRQDYIRTAESKGLRKQSVLLRHGFRNALLPLITLVGLGLPELFSGALIVENVFAYPGMGQLTIRAVGDKDYTIILATTLIFAVLVMIGNLIADVLYVMLDPRIRYN